MGYQKSTFNSYANLLQPFISQNVFGNVSILKVLEEVIEIIVDNPYMFGMQYLASSAKKSTN